MNCMGAWCWPWKCAAQTWGGDAPPQGRFSAGFQITWNIAGGGSGNRSPDARRPLLQIDGYARYGYGAKLFFPESNFFFVRISGCATTRSQLTSRQREKQLANEAPVALMRATDATEHRPHVANRSMFGGYGRFIVPICFSGSARPPQQPWRPRGPQNQSSAFIYRPNECNEPTRPVSGPLCFVGSDGPLPLWQRAGQTQDRALSIHPTSE